RLQETRSVRRISAALPVRRRWPSLTPIRSGSARVRQHTAPPIGSSTLWPKTQAAPSGVSTSLRDAVIALPAISHFLTAFYPTLSAVLRRCLRAGGTGRYVLGRSTARG